MRKVYCWTWSKGQNFQLLRWLILANVTRQVLFLQVLMYSMGLFWKANRHRKCKLNSQHFDFRALPAVKLLNSAAGQGTVQNEVSLVWLNGECVEDRNVCKHWAKTVTVTGKKKRGGWGRGRGIEAGGTWLQNIAMIYKSTFGTQSRSKDKEEIWLLSDLSFSKFIISWHG